MARAAWAVVVPDEGGRTWAGPVYGQQTAQRGELYAALAALTAVAGAFVLYTDSKYVRDGVARLRDGADHSEWKHADLWVQVRPLVLSGRVTVQWVPAHRTAEDYAARGIPERH
eukprot:5384405-Lingulodinium_polyedra.AAC.1